jgi:DNA-binding FadR family transcriptional regulator
MNDARPLQPPVALYEAIADRVRERILRHELRPGDVINESDIVSGYGVSHTPVREALKVLHHEGLLTAQHRRSMVVTSLDAQQLEEALALYQLLRSHIRDEPRNPSDTSAGQCRVPLQQRVLQLVERQLRLAYGPKFDDEMQRLL